MQLYQLCRDKAKKDVVSIPQAVSTVATAWEHASEEKQMESVSIPQAVSTVATESSPEVKEMLINAFQYRKR